MRALTEASEERWVKLMSKLPYTPISSSEALVASNFLCTYVIPGGKRRVDTGK